MNKPRIAASVLSAAIGIALAAPTALPQGMPNPPPIVKENMQRMAQQHLEKCFGVNAVAKNDCAQGAHSCAGQATIARDPKSFVLLPGGDCAKIAGGRLTASDRQRRMYRCAPQPCGVRFDPGACRGRAAVSAPPGGSLRTSAGCLVRDPSGELFGGGVPLRHLEAIRRDYSLSFHAVGLSLGSADGIDARHLDRLRELVARFQPELVSEHLSWSVVDGCYLADLLPLPLTEEALSVVCRNIDTVQTVLGCRILVENPSSYLRYRHSTIPNGRSWPPSPAGPMRRPLRCQQPLRQRLQPRLVAASISPGSTRPRSAKSTLPAIRSDRSAAGSRFASTTTAPGSSPRWSLYAEALAVFGPVPKLIEWDTDVPPLDNCSTRRRRLRRSRSQGVGDAIAA